ncbi:DsbA family protein [Actinokineospora sp. NBRC 105648]|uniref:DsbA family oxidoreductase n=1 Tax=Actinokineospora sp. NBRC 105648 TaxID=3032206 RepID=UPI0024A2A2B9|nr:DsbA family protein [Actinokineospora sp. NBRC 105648]GLZ42520.1 polyketide synthase [Actinokineospora sp. NBRC 105648]
MTAGAVTGGVLRVEVYSDVSCPWCYLATRSLHAAVRELGEDRFDVVAHPYQIDGEEPARPVPMLEFLAGKYGQDKARRMSQVVTETGARLGVEFRNAEGFSVNTLQAHRLLWMVDREHGWRARAQVEQGLFAEWFTLAGNVADPAVLLRHAVRAGVPEARAAAFLESDEDLVAVRARIAATRTEVALVPTVVVGATRVEQYQSTEDYRSVLQSHLPTATSRRTAL